MAEEAKEWFGHFQKAAAEIVALRARLAEVEADHAATRAANRHVNKKAREQRLRAEAAEARLAAVEALPDWAPDDTSWATGYNVAIHNARAAARGDGDRPAGADAPHPFHMSSYVGAEPRCWCDRFASDPIHSREGDR